MHTFSVSFDRGPLGCGSAFAGATDLIEVRLASEMSTAFCAMEKARSLGKWLAGFVSYEVGYLLDAGLELFQYDECDLPLLVFGVFDEPTPWREKSMPKGGELGFLEASWNFAEYENKFQEIHSKIAAGDIYQANLTFPLRARVKGPPRDLYLRMRARQEVPYGAFVEMDEIALLSRSPELFFSLSAAGTLTALPMKGTAPRGKTVEEDLRFGRELGACQKNRAENLMIVDVLRNDLGRVSEFGSVQVPKLFTVERYKTLHQMTSQVTSKLRVDVGLAELFAALFPCGSVTGAPKIRAMQILAELEQEPRQAYCGSIGWIAPDGSMEFNVAIRTITCRSDKVATLNVGGGIVYDSKPDQEYAEAILKSRFAVLN